MAITERGDLALVRGWPAVELLEAVAAPRMWSKSGKGYVVERRFVADLLAAAETRRIFVRLVEARAA